jgi:hypothetical protein
MPIFHGLEIRAFTLGYTLGVLLFWIILVDQMVSSILCIVELVLMIIVQSCRMQMNMYDWNTDRARIDVFLVDIFGLLFVIVLIPICVGFHVTENPTF